MNHIFATVTLAVLLFAPSVASGLGTDHKPGDLPKNDGWVTGIYEIVNQPNRVHGYWINSSDMLFYRGKATELNRTIDDLAKINGAVVEIVLHVGPGKAKSPWSEKTVSPAEWSIRISGKQAITQVQDQIVVDIWLGGDLSLDELRIPESLRVTSGDEIASFIRQREPKEAPAVNIPDMP